MHSFLLVLTVNWQLAVPAAYSIPAASGNQWRQALQQARQDTTRLRLWIQPLYTNRYVALAHLLSSVDDQRYAYASRANPVEKPNCFEEALQEANYTLLPPRQDRTVTGIMASLARVENGSEGSGGYQKALEAYREQQPMKEPPFTDNSGNRVAQLQTQFKSETEEPIGKIPQKNAQVNPLKALQQQQLNLARQTQLTNAIIICLLLILIGVVFYFLFQARHNYLQLQKITHELVEANTVKDKLFSIISHDLRSPLSLIKTTLYQVQQSNELPSLLIVNRLNRQLDSVLDLLNNLLDWSMIQFKEVELNQEPLFLQDTLSETLSQASDLIEQKQLGLINHVEKTHLVLANKHQLRTILRNLVNNAIKFTPANGYIRLQSIQKDGFTELNIRDSGIGMSPEQVANVLTKPEVRTGTAGELSTGIGLRISKELVERLGGTIQVESWPQKGTLIRIRLKTAPHQALRVA